METIQDLYQYVNRMVEITTKSNSRVINGIVVTIDPETHMILLIKKDDYSKSHIINGDMVVSKTILDPDTSYESITKAYLSKLFDRPNQTDALVRRTVANNSKCARIIELLKKNNQPVVNESGVLKISDQLIILPPYGCEQCISNDKYLLETVTQLIKNMS